MGFWLIVRRRLRAHPAAVATVMVTVLLSSLVIATLQVFSSAVADGAVATTVAQADPPGRLVTVRGAVADGRLPAMDETIDAVARSGFGDAVEVRRWASSPSYGLPNHPATDHVQLAEVKGIRDAVEVVEGAWPGPADAARASPVPVAVPVTTARELGWRVGTTVRLRDLITGSSATRIRVVALWQARNQQADVWIDDPFGGAGVTRTDFTTYGPLVVGDGMFHGAAVTGVSAAWRIEPDLGDLTPASVGTTRRSVDQVIAQLDASEDLGEARVTTRLPGTLEAAARAGSAAATALLTPTVLLLVLALSAVVLASGLVVTLREQESRLLRARGASTAQVCLLALAEGALLTVPGGVLALVLAPTVAGLLPGADVTARSPGPRAWVGVGVAALLTLAVLVVSAGLTGRLRTSSAKARRRGPIRAFVGSVGLDVTLLVLGAVGVVQLRRYRDAPTTDPLIVLAPTLVVAALCAVSLRALPLLAGVAGRMAASTRGLPFAWGAWQVARRLRDQVGAVLLILIAVAMGSLALTQQATTTRAVADQAAYAAGAPLRVAPDARVRDDPRLASAYAGLLSDDGATGAGESTARVMAARQDITTVGPLDEVTVLAVDADRADAVMTARADQLGGSTWSALVKAVTPDGPGVTGVPLPDEPTRIAITGRVPAQPDDSLVTSRLTAVLEDADGHWFRVPLGELTSRGTSTVSAPITRTSPVAPDTALVKSSVRYPLTLVGLTTTYNAATRSFFFGWGGEDLVLSTRLTGLSVVEGDGATVPVDGVRRLVWSSDPLDPATRVTSATREPVPVLVTRTVAEAADVRTGDTFSLSHLGRQIPVRVAGVVASLPAIADPGSGVLIDLGALQRAEALASDSAVAALGILAPTQWWLAPAPGQAAGAGAALTEHPGLAADVVSRAALEERETSEGVTAGLRGAMRLVGLAAVALAAIGFAATTVTLGRLRRSESAVLTALGLSPRALRRVLVAERLALVVLTTLVGIGVGVVAAWLTVPLLVTAAGHAAVPAVLVRLPWPSLALLGIGIVTLLGTVALLAVRAVPRSEVTATLRKGDHE